MKLKEHLSLTRQALSDCGIENAPLEGELLLRRAMDIDRTRLYQSFDDELSPRQQKKLQTLTQRCLSGEPSAYIDGQREFYGLDFYVNHNTLIPRPETELLVDKVISLAQDYKQPVIADIGTGCGTIAVSLAMHLPQAAIYAIDISAAALETARRNAQKHNVAGNIRFIEGDLLAPLPQPTDFITANLPYVEHSDINPDSFEPVLALDGGADGLDVIKRLCRQLDGKLNPGGWLLLEIGQGQGDIVKEMLLNLFPKAETEITPDLAGIERMVVMRLPS